MVIKTKYDDNAMDNRHYYTEEELIEIQNNPYTLYATPGKVVFTMAFKKFVVAESKKPGMTPRKIFVKAGYRDGLFTAIAMYKRVSKILEEASSSDGLKEPQVPKYKTVPKKQTAARIADLEEQVLKLQQQVDFLKKIRHLEETGTLPPTDSS